MTPPCVLHEDEHLLVVNKPAGWNTHSPAPYAGEGIYDWLRHCEPRWADLAIIHRLDKETSGVLVFAKTPLANKSLSEQFEQRQVTKRYRLVTDRPPPTGELVVRSNIARDGERYASLPTGAGGDPAETRFAAVGWTLLSPKAGGPSAVQGIGDKSVPVTEVTAQPLTGRTHQIRVHAAANGFPILGDILYGGTPAARVFLHAAEITLNHPATRDAVTFRAPWNLAEEPRLVLRTAMVEAPSTTAFRLIHGAADGWPGWQVEQLGDHLLSQSEAALTDAQTAQLSAWLAQLDLRGAYHKHLDRRVRETKTAQASPQLVLGEPAPERFTIRENGLAFELSFTEGYSYGLFPDQRDNRRRLLTGHVAAGFSVLRAACGAESGRVGPVGPTQHAARSTILNCFSYTCAFSVAAAKAGAHTTSLDLSKKYLEWGKRNFSLNDLDPAAHDFIYGDVFDWLRRLAKKGRQFDAVLLDPPTFSQSKESGVFRAEKDYGRLVTQALPLLKPDGILFASTNCATLSPEEFLATIEVMIERAGRRSTQQHYVPQPPDFPITRDEPAHLKTVWLRVS